MSIYRNVVWYFRGLKEYTKAGYVAASKSFQKGDLDVDCTGRSFMITGANSGIGKECAKEIAKRGGTIHMVCRSQQRGEEALQEIKQETQNNNIHLHLLDMAQPKNVADFAKEFESSGKHLHVLINNAGCMVNNLEMTEDGIEKNFATNTLGTYILTMGLLPVLSKEQDPRVVLVSSGGMLVMKLDVKDLYFKNMKPFDGTFAYAQNKRQQVIMGQQLANDNTNIHFSSMHPGWADTPAVKNSMPEFYEKMGDKLRTVDQGADTLVWLAISPAASKHAGGLFFQDRKPVAIHLPLAWTKSSPQDEKLLMTKLEELRKQFIV